MAVRKFALYGGIVMLVMGVLALIPGLSGDTSTLPMLKNEVSYGLFLGVFPMNIFNKLALIVFGLWGIASSRAPEVITSIYYSRIVLYVMGALAILGLFTATNTLGGYWPLFSGEVVAHAIFAILGGYFGYAAVGRVRRETEARV